MAKYIFGIVFALTLAWFSALSAKAAESEPVKSGRVVAQLVSSFDVTDPNLDGYIGLYMRLEPKWHTYWRNPGGPGAPVSISWQLPDGVTVGDMVWPIPKIVHTGPIANYAFEDRLLLPMPLRIDPSVSTDTPIHIQARADYLVCHIVCLPETAELSLTLPVGEAVTDNRWHGNIERALAKAPKTSKAQASISTVGGKLQLAVLGAYENPYFFPYFHGLINADDPQALNVGKKGIALSMTPGFEIEAEGLNDSVSGVLAYDLDGERVGIELTAVLSQAPLSIGARVSPNSASNGTEHTSGPGLLLALIGGFIGGLILNFMPCVFPVLSMKVLSFSRTAHDDPARVRREGWAYTLGVVVSFMTLASLLVALKSMGAALGWGFQLQNPLMISALAALFVLIAFNLFGGFEVGGRVQNVGAGLTAGQSLTAAFFTGVLAVLVASPCTAPFMAGAMSFAFTQPPVITLLVFLALAIGFATPFLALAYAPKLLSRLPKPGPWMQTFRQLMAFPMLLTAIWLYWVLAGLSGPDGLAAGLLAALMLVFAIWAWRHGNLGKVSSILALIVAGFIFFGIDDMDAPKTEISALENAQPWSAQAVSAAQAQGRTVFVDFTADWCVTCKFNERLVLNRSQTRKLFQSTNTQVLVADWTAQDDEIAQELARHGRSGVPLYLVYGPHSNTPQILPQTLSYERIKSALEQARQSVNN